jgi:ectoine hydroxylase-related dioxygenase (phytanoyl-CoA dioxygenase family)
VALSPRQIDRFYTDGYLVVEDALAEADLAPVIREYEERIDRRARELYAARKLSRPYEEEPFERRLACICGETMELYPEMDIMHHRGKAAFDFLRNERLLDLVEAFVGPEITCSPIQHIRPKLPAALAPELQGKGDTHVVPWHQDAGVTWADADPHFILTVWLPLVDATLENGCLEVLAGMIGAGLLPHHTKAGVGTTIVPEQIPRTEPVVLPIKKGGLIFLHKETPHRSTPNRTDTVRWSIDLRYQKTGTPTGRPFHPEFVARSRANPASVLTDHAAWCRMWEEGLAAARAAGVSMHRWAKVE